ncbi:glycosyltransferase [Winogradskyella sp. R77965]|uniref:glycosyltransferase n=1 Tax=Winogradskyella sp. R77965 TaxID=3093872 RepID=UPI0037DD7B1B
MRLSVVIPVYNAEHLLSKCLDSLLDQNLDSNDIEILVVNDGSLDSSKEIAVKNSAVKLIDKVNGGVGSARNAGLEEAIGKYIYFLDPDDYLKTNVLEGLLDTIETNSLDILTFDSLTISDSKRSQSIVSNEVSHLSPIVDGENYIANEFYNNEVWRYIIDNEFLKETTIRFIEGRWMEDAIFTAKLFLKARRMAHLSVDAHRYLVSPGSAMTSKEPSHYIKVIKDNYNAALVFNNIINDLKSSKSNNEACLNRLRTRQQSFVFFLMVRILKSTIKLQEVKAILKDLELIKAYPMHKFKGKDYNGFKYSILIPLFNKKATYFLLFKIFNPIFRGIYKSA